MSVLRIREEPPVQQKQLSHVAVVVIILVVIVIVCTVGWFVFMRPRPESPEQLAVKAIVGQAIARESEVDTAMCLVKATKAEWCSIEHGGTYLAIDCEVMVRPLKGTADKVITSPPDVGETYRERVTLLAKGKEIGRVTIPTYYEHDGYHLRVREVFHDVSTTPAN
jgi:hypothetical protein